MKVKSSTSIEELKGIIQNELGLDLSKYRDDAVAQNFVELLMFPKYIAKWVALPLLLFMLLYIVGFFVVDLIHVQYLIYGIFGLVLFLISGVFFGVLYMTTKLKEDIKSMSAFSLNILRSCIYDLDDVKSRINRNNIKDVFGLLFNGIINIVSIPMISTAIDEKVPVANRLVKGVVTKFLSVISNRISFDPDNIDESIKVDESANDLIKKSVAIVDSAENRISSIIVGSTRIVQAPFRLVFIISTLFLFLLIYLIW